jgi:hypothetical protein
MKFPGRLAARAWQPARQVCHAGWRKSARGKKFDARDIFVRPLEVRAGSLARQIDD